MYPSGGHFLREVISVTLIRILPTDLQLALLLSKLSNSLGPSYLYLALNTRACLSPSHIYFDCGITENYLETMDTRKGIFPNSLFMLFPLNLWLSLRHLSLEYSKKIPAKCVTCCGQRHLG